MNRTRSLRPMEAVAKGTCLSASTTQHKACLCPGLRAGAVRLPGLEINRKLFSINYLVLTFQSWPDGDEGGIVDVNAVRVQLSVINGSSTVI